MFWVYLLLNPAGNFYTGHTDNLENLARLIRDRLVNTKA